MHKSVEIFVYINMLRFFARKLKQACTYAYRERGVRMVRYGGRGTTSERSISRIMWVMMGKPGMQKKFQEVDMKQKDERMRNKERGIKTMG